MHAILLDAQHIHSAISSDWRASLLRERQTQLGLDPRPSETSAQMAVRAREMFRRFATDGTLARIGNSEARLERAAIQAEEDCPA